MHLFFSNFLLLMFGGAGKEILAVEEFPRYLTDSRRGVKSSSDIRSSFSSSSSSNSNFNQRQSINGPCDDFFEYACRDLPEGDEPGRNLKRNLLQTMEQSLRDQRVASEMEEKAKAFFRSCLKATKELDSLTSSETIRGLEEILEQLDKWSISQYKANLQEKLETLHNDYGLSPLFSWRVGKDIKNAEENVIEIFHEDNTFFGLDDPAQSEPFTKILKESRWIRSLIARISGGRLNDRSLEQVIVLEDDLRKIMEPPLAVLTEPREYLSRYNALSLSQLQQMAGFINWKKFFDHAFVKINRRIHDHEKIILWIPDYLTKLSDRLQRFQDENPRLLDNMFTWLAVKGVVSEIVVGGAMALDEREGRGGAHEICTRLTDRHFEFVMARLFSSNYYQKPEAKRKIVLDMAEDIRSSIISILGDSRLPMDETSRRRAIEKIGAVRVEACYPDFIVDPTSLTIYYGSQRLHVSESDCVGNLVRLLQLHRRRNTHRLRRPVDNKGEWPGWPRSPLALSTFSDYTSNRIFIPMGVLQEPYFDLNFPPSTNYGVLGWFIGREFVHALTGLGSSFDKRGQFYPPLDSDAEKTASCLVDQYSAFVDSRGRYVNGSSTLAENAADNGGLEVAARAFIRRFPITEHENLAIHFFMSFARSGCGEAREGENGSSVLPEQNYSPNKLRVMGVLQNSRIFSRAFKCPADSVMNPSTKCKIL